MKRLVPLFLFFLLSYSLNAQSVNDIQELLFLAQYTSAEDKAQKAKLKDPEMAYWYIQSLIVQNKIAEASGAVTELIKIHPNHKLLKIAKGQVTLHEGKKTEAKAIFQDLLNKSAGDKAEVSIAIGSAYAQVPRKYCDPDFAISILKEAQTLQPNNGLIHIYIGDCNQQKLKGGDAMSSYNRAMIADKKLEALAYHKIAAIHLTMDECESALFNLSKSIKANAKFLPAIETCYQLTANVEKKCYDKEKSIAYYNDYIKVASNSYETEIFKALHSYRMKDYPAALQHIKEIQTKWPKQSTNKLIMFTGQCYYAQKDYPNAIIAFEKYLIEEKNTDDVSLNTLTLLAKSYAETGNSVKAKATYLKAAEQENDLPEKLELMEKAAAEDSKGKKYLDAATIYEQINSLKKTPSASDYFKCGIAWYQAKNYQKSKTVFSAYSQAYPNDWIPQYYMANNEAQLDTAMSKGLAVPFYEKTIALGSKEAKAKMPLIQSHWYLFGYEYHIKKNITAAIQHLDEILALEPTHAEALKYKKLLVP